jgi:hypothetical protein
MADLPLDDEDCETSFREIHFWKRKHVCWYFCQTLDLIYEVSPHTPTITIFLLRYEKNRQK